MASEAGHPLRFPLIDIPQSFRHWRTAKQPIAWLASLR